MAPSSRRGGSEMIPKAALARKGPLTDDRCAILVREPYWFVSSASSNVKSARALSWGSPIRKHSGGSFQGNGTDAGEVWPDTDLIGVGSKHGTSGRTLGWLLSEVRSTGRELEAFRKGNSTFLIQLSSVPPAPSKHEFRFPRCAFASPSVKTAATQRLCYSPAFYLGGIRGSYYCTKELRSNFGVHLYVPDIVSAISPTSFPEICGPKFPLTTPLLA
jgi:hypothetical protein